MCMCQIDVLEVDGEYYGGFLDPLIIGLLDLLDDLEPLVYDYILHVD